jgi:hypothetical protein
MSPEGLATNMIPRLLLFASSLAVAAISCGGFARAEEITVVCGESNKGLVSTFYIDLTKGAVNTAIAGVEWGKDVEKIRTFRARVDNDWIAWEQFGGRHYELDRHTWILVPSGTIDIIETERSRNCRLVPPPRRDGEPDFASRWGDLSGR